MPMEKYPKLLGVKFDPLFSFSQHAAMVARKAADRLKVLRALSDTEFGKDKECMLSTYKTFIRPLFDYAAPIVYPNMSPSSILRLQRIQNKSLRLVTGCHTAAAIDHLHDECDILPVGEHMKLLSAQFLAGALAPTHPSHKHVTGPQGRRRMKETLRTKVFDDVAQYTKADGTIQAGDVRKVQDMIHTDIVGKAIASQEPNKVLNTKPPRINKNESTLCRKTRTTLAQLRSGHCARLKAYQHKIGKVDDDKCPDCDIEAQDVSHLFNCPARPTGLTTRALWSDPGEVAHFLSSHPAFDGIPPPTTPPPRRRRRRGRPPSTSSARSSLFLPLSIPDSPSFSDLSFSFSLFSPEP